MSLFARKLNQNLLKYSAGTAIFCPLCHSVADARRWVLITQGDHTRQVCAPCWDRLTKGRPVPPDVDVVDGRIEFGKTKRAHNPDLGFIPQAQGRTPG